MPLLRRGARPTERIALPESGEWVEVITRLSAGEREKLTATGIESTLRMQLRNAAARGGAEALDMPIDTDRLMEAVAFRALEIGIVEWSFDEPVTPDAIRALDEESHALITHRLDVLWDRRTEEERKNSAAAGQMPSSMEGATQPRSDG